MIFFNVARLLLVQIMNKNVIKLKFYKYAKLIKKIYILALTRVSAHTLIRMDRLQEIYLVIFFCNSCHFDECVYQNTCKC